MEKQIPLTTPGHWLNRNIIGMGIADFFSDTSHEMATAIVPIFLATTLGAPAFSLGLIEGVSDGIAMFFMVFAGWYSDKVGKRKGIAVLGYGVLAIGMASMAWAANWWEVLASRTFGWIGWSSRSPVRDALLLESTTPQSVGRVFAFHGVMDTLGAIAGPLIATLLLAHISPRDIFLISFVPGLCAFLAVVFFVKETAKMRIERSVWGSMKSLSPDLMGLLIPVGIFGVSNFAPTFFILRSQELLTPVYGATFAAMAAVGLYAFGNIVYAAVNYPIGVLLDNRSKRNVLVAGYAIFGVLCFGFSVAVPNIAVLLVLFALNGAYTAIVESAEPALASEFMRDEEHGSAYGMLNFTQGVGDFFSSIIVGILWTFAAPLLGFMFAGVLAIIAATWLFFFRGQWHVRAPITTSV
jgi:MFS family permease